MGESGSGQTVAVNPQSLRSMGDDITGAREALADNQNHSLLHGTGNHTSISTGEFPPGVGAEARLTSHYVRMAQALHTVETDMMALSSAAFILADVYEEGDHDEALKFAFADPNAEVPDGLPWGFNHETTYLEQLEEEQEEDGESQEPAGPGEIEVPEDGNTKYQVTVEEGPEGYYRQHEVTEVYDADDQLVVSHHTVTTPGGVEYYTEHHDSDGDVERSGEMEFGDQNAPAREGEHLERRIDELVESLSDLDGSGGGNGGGRW